MKKLIILFILLAITIVAGLNIAAEDAQTDDELNLELKTQALMIQKQTELAEQIANEKFDVFVCND